MCFLFSLRGVRRTVFFLSLSLRREGRRSFLFVERGEQLHSFLFWEGEQLLSSSAGRANNSFLLLLEWRSAGREKIFLLHEERRIFFFLEGEKLFLGGVVCSCHREIQFFLLEGDDVSATHLKVRRQQLKCMKREQCAD